MIVSKSGFISCPKTSGSVEAMPLRAEANTKGEFNCSSFASNSKKSAPCEGGEEKPKRKQGVNIAPYIDKVKEFYSAHEDIQDALINYIIQVNRQRAIWTMEEWEDVLRYLYESTSISIPGTSGRKVIPSQVFNKIQFALTGNGKTPYMDFKSVPPSMQEETFVPSFDKKGY